MLAAACRLWCQCERREKPEGARFATEVCAQRCLLHVRYSMRVVQLFSGSESFQSRSSAKRLSLHTSVCAHLACTSRVQPCRCQRLVDGVREGAASVSSASLLFSVVFSRKAGQIHTANPQEAVKIPMAETPGARNMGTSFCLPGSNPRSSRSLLCGFGVTLQEDSQKCRLN